MPATRSQDFPLLGITPAASALHATSDFGSLLARVRAGAEVVSFFGSFSSLNFSR